MAVVLEPDLALEDQGDEPVQQRPAGARGVDRVPPGTAGASGDAIAEEGVGGTAGGSGLGVPGQGRGVLPEQHPVAASIAEPEPDVRTNDGAKAIERVRRCGRGRTLDGRMQRPKGRGSQGRHERRLGGVVVVEGGIRDTEPSGDGAQAHRGGTGRGDAP